MSKLRDAWDARLTDVPWPFTERMEAAITEAEETIARLTRERDEALARVKVMDEALKPFAKIAYAYDPPEDDDNQTCWEEWACPTLGHLRAARAARKEPT